MSDPIPLKAGLYVTATPIGNLGDMTFRAVETLRGVDLIACEDTRRSAKLCAAYDIKTPRHAYHDHNGARVRPRLLERLKAGERIALVSDAGTPLIADPGYQLVRDARREGVAVFAVPGASAAVAALSIAGAPSDRFLFAGFAPARKARREEFFAELAAIDATLIFYETGPRLARSLASMARALPRRRAVICRELTKLHETVEEGDPASLAGAFETAPPKGEIVVILTPATPAADASPEDIDALLRTALAAMSVKDAAAAAAAQFSISRKDAYARALALKGEGEA